jgi:2-keto-4-pentenoate hydratase
LLQIAESFVAARVEGRSLADYPGPFPKSLDEAYAIQAAAIDLMDRPVVGWKIARIRPDLVVTWGADRIAGPVFNIWDAYDDQPVIPAIAGGYAATEAEFQLLLREMPTGSTFVIDDIEDIIGAVRIGIEVAGSPFGAINAFGPAVTVSDFGNNIGLVLGKDVPNWREAIGRTVSSFVNKRPVGSAIPAETAGDPLEAVGFLFELAARYGLPVKSGQWISAGAITGGHKIASGDEFEAHFGDSASVSCRIR